MNYNRSIPDYGDVMTIEKFKEYVVNGMFIDYDGNGYPIKDGRMCDTICIRPSTVGEIPIDATHVIWFNK